MFSRGLMEPFSAQLKLKLGSSMDCASRPHKSEEWFIHPGSSAVLPRAAPGRSGPDRADVALRGELPRAAHSLKGEAGVGLA